MELRCFSLPRDTLTLQAKGLHDLVLEEGREYASLWDAGDSEVNE